MDNHEYKNEWAVIGRDFGVAGLTIAEEVRRLGKSQQPEYLEFFPFGQGYDSNSFVDGDLVIIRLENTIGQMPQVGTIKDETLISISKDLFARNRIPHSKKHLKYYRKLDLVLMSLHTLEIEWKIG